MKNIHIIPTDKPSNGYILGKCIKELSDVKIGQFTKTYYLMFDKEYFQPQNIYITSDEEIKEGDWFYDLDTKYIKIKQSWENSHLDFNAKKIILTTDQDLIKDGVQSIDDEFVEWLVEKLKQQGLLIGEPDNLVAVRQAKEMEKQQQGYSEEEVELIANEMVNWAIDNIGNPNPQSGKKFDEVMAKFKNK